MWDIESHTQHDTLPDVSHHACNSINKLLVMSDRGNTTPPDTKHLKRRLTGIVDSMRGKRLQVHRITLSDRKLLPIDTHQTFAAEKDERLLLIMVVRCAGLTWVDDHPGRTELGL